jgi:leader peptidase (prepilin peptidase)/N-methyltransferase
MADWFLYAYAFLLGAVTGSFLNVCVHRLPRGFLLHTPPSHCPFCNVPIRWYDNVPIVGYLLLGRRCRFCGIRISPRYAIVEAVTGLLFAYITHTLVAAPGGPELARLGVYVALAAALVAASFVDFEFRIIPDEISIPGMFLAPVVSLVWPHLHEWREPIFVQFLARLIFAEPLAHPHACGLVASLVGMGFGAGIIWALGIVGRVLFRKEAMGFGDVKLMGFVGAVIGWKLVVLAIVVAAFVGAAVGVVSLLWSRDTRLPFGPYLSIGSLVAALHHQDIAAWFARFSESVQGGL